MLHYLEMFPANDLFFTSAGHEIITLRCCFRQCHDPKTFHACFPGFPRIDLSDDNFSPKASSPMPVLLMLMGLAFNLVNGSLHGAWLFVHPVISDSQWLGGWQFIAGAVMFAGGMALNIDSSRRLLRLKKANPDNYSIPRGGLFRWVSCPNYLGEIVEWLGWALLTWSPAGLAFAAWTMANLVPRARAHHRWYRERFSDYPTKRKALVPGFF